MLKLALILAASLAGAQDKPGLTPPGLTPPGQARSKPQITLKAVRPEKSDVAVGETFKVAFDLVVPAGWYTYPTYKKGIGSPTVFRFKGATVAGKIEEPKAKTKKGTEIIPEYDYHVGAITMTVPVRLDAGTAPGPLTVKGTIDYQICDPTVCVPGKAPFSFEVGVAAGSARDPDQESPPLKVLSVKSDTVEVKVGQVFKVAFEVEVPAGWHIYPTYRNASKVGFPTEFKFPAVELGGKIEEPKAKVHPKGEILPAYDYHDGKLRFVVPFRLKPGPPPGDFSVEGKIVYYICNPSTCEFADVPASFNLSVLEGEVAVAPPVSSGGDDAASQAAVGELEERGLMGFFLLAVVGGLVSLIMPCVYPLIPITVTYFMKQGGDSRSKGLMLSSTYAMGMILSFTSIGFVFSLALGGDGARIFASLPLVNICVAVLFLWFAFSLFGLYEIKLPSGLMGRLTGPQRKGAGGAFVLGVLFSVVTFTCTIPITATILAVAASGGTGNRFIGLAAMLVYSATMAVPFFFLGLFPSYINRVRKGGGDWLHTVKVTAGFAELALALVYLAKADVTSGWGFLTRNVMIAVWVAVLIFMALYLLRVFSLKGDDEGSRQVGIVRLLTAMLFGVMAVFFASGFSGRRLGELDIVLPPPPVEAEGPVEAASGRQRKFFTLENALKEAREVDKPVFVEFTGVN